MSYSKIIVRRRGLEGLWDDIKNAASGALNIYAQGQRDAGAAQALQQQQQATVAPAPSGGGIDTKTLLVIGAVGIGAVLLLKKKKS